MPEGPICRQIDQCCVYRPTGVATAGELAHRIADVLSRARDEKLPHMLVDIRAVSGFESPGPAFRRWAVRLWASKSAGVRVAMVARRELICPKKTGLLAAAEEGLHASIFEHESEAVAWLDKAD